MQEQTVPGMAGVCGSASGSSIPAISVLEKDHYRDELVQLVEFVVAAGVEELRTKTFLYPVRATTIPDGVVFRYTHYSHRGNVHERTYYVVRNSMFVRTDATILNNVPRRRLQLRVFPAVVAGRQVVAYQFQYHAGMKDWLKFRGAKWEPTQKFWYSEVELELPADVEVVRE